MRKLLLVLGVLGLVAVGVMIMKKKGGGDDFAAVAGAESFDASSPN